ncbi:RsmE family RNA methyltransferase [Candidatus Saccharibacteria bacterium]|nr:16S rRNA (uracil(1498)-N(3))-methyltransferase [Candidatus Saccharibacteria bacterium]NIV04256.1 RsmE family RNA methyltransferase [Calditrichia bacterium]NIS38798.1 16S rRNA (uracil(1498)-N(3))-methyltransferase [Candidatus Saccharibacteria bacterium]NIV72729.1 RsmE family RNA methyltransferase [Calditrichia bacterium]NIV99905.1 RsmE family RNA methyltransferase [Candidatus Saccharibacteria bacterium]
MDNTGKIYKAQVMEINKKEISGTVMNIIEKPDAPKYQINLCMALLKKDKFEWVLEKACELGVSEITPIITKHCVKKIDKISERWHKIVREASEQCGRTTLPKINNIVAFKEAMKKYSPGIICYANGQKSINEIELPKVINLYVGPEGDFTDEEISLASQNKIEPVNLGSNILRAETAAIAAMAILNI